MLGKQLANMQNYFQAAHNARIQITLSITMAAGEKMLRVHDRTLLRHIEITKTCAASFLKRMGCVECKTMTKCKPGMFPEGFEWVKKAIKKLNLM